MKKFSDWNWKIQIIFPIIYSSIISMMFIIDFFLEKSFIKFVFLFFITTGYILMIVDRFQLKNKFSIFPQARGLQKTGLYKFFSHPIYLFSCLSTIGICCYLIVKFSNFYIILGSSIFLILYVIMQYIRAKKESKKLFQEYGNNYNEYIKKTIL